MIAKIGGKMIFRTHWSMLDDGDEGLNVSQVDWIRCHPALRQELIKTYKLVENPYNRVPVLSGYQPQPPKSETEDPLIYYDGKEYKCWNDEFSDTLGHRSRIMAIIIFVSLMLAQACNNGITFESFLVSILSTIIGCFILGFLWLACIEIPYRTNRVRKNHENKLKQQSLDNFIKMCRNS